MLVKIFEAYQPNLYSIPVFCVAFFTLFVGSFIFLQNKRSAVNITFFLICLDVSMWLLGSATLLGINDPVLGVWLYRNWTFMWVSFISTGVYWFSVTWFKLFRKQWPWVVISFPIALTFGLLGKNPEIGVMSVVPQFWGLHAKYGIASILSLVTFFGFFFAALFNFLNNYRQETDKTKKIQIRLIAIAFLISFTGAVDYISKVSSITVYPFGYISVFSWILIVAFTIVRYKAMDIETVIHKTLMWLAVTAVAIAPFAALTWLTRDWLKDLSGGPLSAWLTLQALVFYFYFSRVQPVLSHWFRRRHANLQAAFQTFTNDLVHLKDLKSLLQRLVRLIRRSLYVRQVSVYLLNDDKTQLVPVIAKGMRGAKPVAAHHPFLIWLASKDQVMLLDFVRDDPSVRAIKTQLVEYFDEVNASVAVPLMIGEQILGVLHLGRKENLQGYRAAEVQFLAQLKAPVTIALSNSLQFENVSKLYKQVQTQNERLKELDRLKSQFLANTSHELRTPLNGILGLVEAVLDGADGEVNTEQARHLRMILESGANLKELINNLLELSKLESGQTQLHVKSFSMLNAVTAVLALLEGIAHKKGVRLQCESEDPLPDVYGDPEKIQRVLLNLAGNALKFTEKGSVTIHLRKHNGRVRVSVEDTGIGIKEKDLKVIFERFHQADGGETRNYEGTGLGLAIARDIVRLHHSDISVTSQFGQGSTFAFEMPTASFEAEAAAAQTEGLSGKADEEPLKDTDHFQSPDDVKTAAEEKVYEVTRNPEEEEIAQGHGELVLVVDDNAVNREVIRARLGMHNYRVVEAVDGQDALEKVNSDKPALVLLDLMMPRMSGYEFCRQVRKLYSADQLPIIMLTAKTEMGDKVLGLNIGANDYLPKPFHQEELLARVGVFLRLRAMHEELREWNTQLEIRVEERTRDLHAAQKQLIQAEKMATVGTFAGGIAHEINNPLTAVLTNAQVLKMTSSNEEDKELVDLIEEGAKRCQVIIQKLMKYSRKADTESQRQTVLLNQVVESVCGLLSYQLLQDNVSIEQDLAGLPPIQGNAGEMEQVFTNMILNARDAILSAGREQGVIRIQGRQSEKEIRVEVVDNGTGIKEENLTKIFDPFFTTKDVGSGTGLGLSVTHGILERHSCRVFVESTWSIGTTFVLVFRLGNATA